MNKDYILKNTYYTEKYHILFTIKENGRYYSFYKDGKLLKENILKYDLFFTYKDKKYQIEAPECDLDTNNDIILDAFITSCRWTIENKIKELKLY